MKLRLVSETSSKAHFEYDRGPAGTEGYYYFKDGVRVSRTFDPDDLKVTFGKPFRKVAVSAVGLQLLDQAEYPDTQPPGPGEPAPIAGQGYKLVFADDFDVLDTTKWSLNMWYENQPRPGQLRTTGSVLELRAGSSGPNVSICTDQHNGQGSGRSFLYGYFEMKAKWTWTVPGAWPALWLLSLKNRYGQNAASPPSSLASEFDIFEGYHQGLHTPFTGALHRNTSGLNGVPDQVKPVFANPAQDYDTNWHTYAGLWTPTEISWWFDDVQLKRETPWDSTGQPMFLIIDLWLTEQPPSGDALLQVDWVRAWQK